MQKVMQRLIKNIKGCPIAWMMSSNATEPTINYFLANLRAHNPDVKPNIFMSDFDKGQINQIRACYPESMVLLCWWHVLHAWRQHFVTAHFPELWELLKGWIRLTEESSFNERWTKIQQLAPASFVDYINQYWMPVWKMWSARERLQRTIFEISDTNMLIEAYVIPLVPLVYALLVLINVIIFERQLASPSEREVSRRETKSPSRPPPLCSCGGGRPLFQSKAFATRMGI